RFGAESLPSPPELCSGSGLRRSLELSTTWLRSISPLHPQGLSQITTRSHPFASPGWQRQPRKGTTEPLLVGTRPHGATVSRWFPRGLRERARRLVAPDHPAPDARGRAGWSFSLRRDRLVHTGIFDAG